MLLTKDQIHKYFETRLGTTLSNREKVAVKCPFHDDGTASATVFLSGNGGFNCQACGAKGNAYQVEMRFSKCDMETAKRNIAEITGADVGRISHKGPCTGVYDYRLADGRLAFQKRRYEPPEGRKTFSIVRPDGKDGWVSGMEGMEEDRKVLYHLPELVTCNMALVCEGEKDCATLDALTLFPTRPDVRAATTCNFEGAWQPGHSPKWLPRYSPLFSGKHVVIFEDNDESGRTWADHIAASVQPFAYTVRRVSFPELPEKGDVTDWMETHTVEELSKRVSKAPCWIPTEATEKHREVFVSAAKFAAATPEEIDWLITGVLQRGDNGFISAAPKAGKSWVAVDMLISLALGCPWMEFKVPKPIKCGLVSREDNPALTGWRIKKLFSSKQSIFPIRLEENLYVNSKRQTPQFMLDSDSDVAELIGDIKRLQLEFVILDVLNVLHSADENDNTEMTRIMAQVRRLHDESGASLGIIHHYNKGNEGSMTQRLRGAGAIGGFAEWQIGLTVVDEELKIRKMEFEMKADQPPEPIYFQIQPDGISGSRIAKVPYETQSLSIGGKSRRPS
jgi:hypothetical protein